MVTRIGGLASGMDIDSIVEKLMKAERAPLNKLQQKKTLYEWTRDAYRSVNTKLKTFDTYVADNLVLKNLNSKTANVSNSNYLTATATGTATGTLTIEGVSQLASAGRGVGSQVNATSTSKLSELGITANSIELKAIQSNGELASTATKIEFDPNTTTVGQFVSKINSSNAGVSAIFENGRLSITAQKTGDVKGGAEVVVTSGNQVFEKFGFVDSTNIATGGSNAVFQVNGIATERTTNSFTVNGYNITLTDTFNQNSTLTNNYNSARTEYLNASNQDTLNALTTAKTNAVNTFNAAKTAYDNAFAAAFPTSTLSASNRAIYDTVANKDLISNLSSVDLDAIRAQIVTDDAELQTALNNLDPAIKTKLSGVTVAQFNALQQIDSSNINELKEQASNDKKLETYQSLGNSFFNGLTAPEKTKLNAMSSLTEEEYNNQITALTVESASAEDKALGAKLNTLTSEQKTLLRNTDATQIITYSSLANLEIDYRAKEQLKNNATNDLMAAENRKATAEVNLKEAYKAYLNDPTVDVSLTNPPIFAAPMEEVRPVTISSTTNVDDMMSKIKEFVTTYNGFVKDLSAQTKESKYRDYTPLTTEQKNEMEENEIKLWEEKAKSGLLRNDSMILNGLSNMRSLVYQSNSAIEDTRYNTLFSIGITTSTSYNDGGTLEIDEAKLRKAIEENPDAVEKLFKNTSGAKDEVINGKTVDTRGYIEKLREAMKSLEVNIEKRAGRSTMTDAQYTLGKNLTDVESRISTWQDKLENIEARYWKQFTAMETAINKANQQSSLFTS